MNWDSRAYTTQRAAPTPWTPRFRRRSRLCVGDVGLHGTLAQAGRREPAPRPRAEIRSAHDTLFGRRLHAEEALRDFRENVYARSARRPNDARWTTWCKICEAWKIDPVPLSTYVIEKVGASLRKGGYRSSAQYFSRARKEHVQVTGMPVPAPVEIAIRDAIKIH